MGSLSEKNPHAVCIPFPAQGHMNPMLMLAKLLHSRGFHVTYVLTEFNLRRLVRSLGPESVEGFDKFRFTAIPDGLPYSDEDATQDVPSVAESTMKNCLKPFLNLITEINHATALTACPPVSCIVSDGCMSFTLDAARVLGIPEILFWTPSACGTLAYFHYQELVDRNLVPLKDPADLEEFLDTQVDWIPGLTKGMRFKDFPNFMLNDKMLRYLLHETSRVPMATAVVLNTFDALEAPALAALQKILPPVYTIGPLAALARRLVPSGGPLDSISTSLWKEDRACLDWLNSRDPGSVVYVNFGSITVMTNEQLVEFAWGLANSAYDFLWVVRPDLVKGETAVLPPDFVRETRGRALMASWCPQEEVLAHQSVGVFLTHSGWNSTVESISGGVPMICWPFFAEQQANCKYACTDWGIGIEIDNNVKRDGVEGMIREMMAGENGKEMRRKAMEWKLTAAKAVGPVGSSTANFEKVVNEVLHSNN